MKLRRTMLYVPGNNAGMMKDAHIYRSDSVMFDLEDSVAVTEKDSARFLVFNALSTLNYEGIETVVRINGLDTPYGRDDIKAMVRARPDVIRLPKTETPEDVIAVEKLLEIEEKACGYKVGSIKMMAAIEGPLGVLNAYQIAISSKRLIGIALGAEDFVTSIKTKRSPGGIELLFARSQILMAARAAGIYALDTVYSDVNNEEGFLEEVRHIKQLGFDGKSVISPRQIQPVHKIFCPTDKEIDHAIRVIQAIKEAECRSSGVISLNGKMVDKPIVDRARGVLEMALATGIRINELEAYCDDND
ncbi:citrate (pro-3S)-lyase subunit beta [Oceanispirochaeta sp.]|jgi:citrate lyase subunit beta/citryl-CoA lyase|uniref:citrate (pro-3S)-lyase subunit beta n=1 Tax=Oceanispirochaeta sp. TaxID=2035350 RepID=UPI0026274290|nr:citrate (pro-3S)-lyase subunit beta [Oceanispirochaeta sp.]MDA3955295.1 citrate (pro-3S)-lyase subunit beta [Oceanispirochaeta sp.]